jgi:hypothetical protein
MNHYYARDFLCERLRLKKRQSYRLVGSAYGSLISGDDILALLNRSRRSIEKPLEFVPSDIATPDEVEKHFSNGFPQNPITTHALKTWVHREKNVPPHFRLNGHTIRFSLGLLTAWLNERTHVRHYS